MTSTRRSAQVPGAVLAAVLLAGCAFDAEREFERRRTRDTTDGSAAPHDESADAEPVALGPFSVLTWNLEWFQDPEHGPADERRQLEGAQAVLARTGASLIALQEVSTEPGYAALLDALPGYGGVLTRFEWPQQLALLYRTAQFELISQANVTGLPDAGRAPLEVELRSLSEGARLRVVVLHAKAGGRENDWATREGLALGLAAHLEGVRDAAALIVLGDFNDRLSGSIVTGRGSPYAVFVADPGYLAPTAALEAGGEASTAWGQTIDHVLVGAELGVWLQSGSADVLRDELLPLHPRLLEEVSDHLPVMLRLER